MALRPPRYRPNGLRHARLKPLQFSPDIYQPLQKLKQLTLRQHELNLRLRLSYNEEQATSNRTHLLHRRHHQPQPPISYLLLRQ